MTFTVNFEDLLWGALGIIAAIALIYIIITLINLIKVLKNVNLLLIDNKKNLDTTLDNVAHISENAKDISDVVTETTADVIVAKENLTGQLETVKDIVNIIVGVFKK
ncbi:MAG: hypothetical protein ACRCTZ_19510 [Sarcina sp.]